jgi:hypothetical protein
MPRTLWFAAGAGVGVYAMVRARRLAEAFTPDGLRDRAGAAVVGLRAFRDEVAQGQADKETELRQRLHLVPSGPMELSTSGGFETSAAPPPQPPEVGKHKREGTA